MKILAAADIHGNPDTFAAVSRAARVQAADCMVLAGDLCGHLRKHVPQVARWVAGFAIPVLYVRGNSDPGRLDRALGAIPGVTGLHGARAVVAGAAFVGLSGTLLVPFRSRINVFEGRSLARIRPLVDETTVLVTHPPPHGVADGVMGRVSAGSRGLRRFVEEVRPRVLICGHIHESAAVETLGPTLVVNAAANPSRPGALVELSPDGPARARILDTADP